MAEQPDYAYDVFISYSHADRAWVRAELVRRLGQEALSIAERCGYVLQGADAHLVLARIALAAGDRDAAREHAQEARRLATCDGAPDYTYKVAYDEAGALLAEVG